jgi:hypothetical protein
MMAARSIETPKPALQPAKPPALTRARFGVVQRKCSCGGSASPGECPECASKKLQRFSRSSPALGLSHTFANLAVSQPGDAHEREADAMAERVTGLSQAAISLSPSPVSIQRHEDDTGAESPAPDESESVPASASGLIVDDSVAPSSGQMTKSDFLAALRPAAADAVLQAAGPDQASDAGRELDNRFSAAARHDAAFIESEILQSSPEASNATSAADYVPIIAEQIRSLIELQSGGNGGSAPGSEGETAPQESSAAGAEEAGPEVSMKAHDGGPRETGSPRAIQTDLGAGQPMDAGVRSRMESAFGVSFSHVRVHADGTAAELSNQLNARAFTLGEHVAFGRGEYRPGTLIGDALLAHELAHVVQQGSAHESAQGYEALESDADRSAVAAVASLFGPVGRLFASQGAGPSLKTGLRLQRCSGGASGTAKYHLTEPFFGMYCPCNDADPGCLGKGILKGGCSNSGAMTVPCSPGKEVSWKDSDFGCNHSVKDLSTDPCPNAKDCR